MKADIHMHSTFSMDGTASLEEMTKAAIDKGLSIICFTEHFDMNPIDAGTGFFDYDAYSDAIKKLQDSYSDEITILKGLEFSEPHQYRKELERFNGLDFDFILGSVHWSGTGWIGDETYRNNVPLEKLYEMHYEATLETSRCGLFDSLAHIDFPKRYLPSKVEPAASVIDAIIDNLLAHDISLEINTSPLRRGKTEAYPSAFILSRYTAKGGRYCTLGSDAHTSEDIAADFDALPENDDLLVCYYQNRTRRILE